MVPGSQLGFPIPHPQSREVRTGQATGDQQEDDAAPSQMGWVHQGITGAWEPR